MLKRILKFFGFGRVKKRHKHLTWRYKAEVNQHTLVDDLRTARTLQRWGYCNGKKFSYRRFFGKYIIVRVK